MVSPCDMLLSAASSCRFCTLRRRAIRRMIINATAAIMSVMMPAALAM